MTDNNGWSGKPGVPLNPEREGWHCVLGHSMFDKPRPELWSRDQAGVFWWSGMQWSEDKAAKHWTYLGPVLFHNQATALQARVAELEGALRELIDQTHDCEKKLTEKLYRVDFCGESLPLTNARAELGEKE
jgi:hypothetical protein